MNATQTRTEQLVNEAGRKLETYLKTGLNGLKQQAIDRLRDAGIAATMEHDAEHLLEHLELHWNFRS